MLLTGIRLASSHGYHLKAFIDEIEHADSKTKVKLLSEQPFTMDWPWTFNL